MDYKRPVAAFVRSVIYTNA